MRTPAHVWIIGVLLSLVLFARVAHAGASRQHLDDANAALSAEPPRRDDARVALRAATIENDEPEAVAEANFLLGRLDEEDGAYPQALRDYRACVDAAPTTRWAFRASDRIDWLRLRSEDDFRPLLRLERLRHDESLSSDPGAIDALAREADQFPPGMVRVEARMLVAEAWLGRLHRPGDAVGMLRLVTAEKRIDPLTMRLAERELVDALVALGRVDEAIVESTTNANRLDPKFVKRVRRLGRRRVVGYAATGVLIAFVVFAAVALVRGTRRSGLGDALRALRSVAPTTALFVAFVVLGGGFLASQYETGNAQPFLLLGAGALPLALIARVWAAVGSQQFAMRVARSVLCGMAVLAAAFVLLETVNPTYLEGFGL